MRTRWFAFEAVLLCSPAVVFLGATLPEVIRATQLAMQLRQTTQPQLGLVQSALWQWGTGAFALAVLATLAVASARRRVFRYGPTFWVGLVAGLVSAWSMVDPFGAVVAFVVAAPLSLLALHAAYVQSRLRAAI